MISDTIVALATPPGRGGVAVLRLSGPAVQSIAESLLKKIPTPRQACFSSFLSPEDEVIDQGIALFFPAPNSFTGEDVLELQCHGSPIIADWLTETILQAGARLARPGEFSERAFLNGKMDLARAEAVADLIHAASREAAQSALRSLQGEFSTHIYQLVESLVELRMYIESAIDFSEEEINFQSEDAIRTSLQALITRLQTITALATVGSRLCEGMTIVITGKPNAGKSSLLNRLSGRSSAIVTEIPGTTRDVLRENILLGGMPIQLIDTAGLRHDSTDPIEQEGIRRAKEELANADLILSVCDATIETDSHDFDTAITIRNKIDLTTEKPTIISDENGKPIISLSAHTGDGINLLTEEIRRHAGQTTSEGVFSARRRHLDALAKAHHWLTHANSQLSNHESMDQLAEDLRLAQNALGEITGEFTSDDLLGRIFSEFCIGK